MCTVSTPLSQLDVLIADCQATAAAPRGHLLEIGWARAGTAASEPRAWLIALPSGERIPPAVTRITGISDDMSAGGVDPQVAWRELLAAAAALPDQPARTVIHFARFELPILHALAGGPPPLDIVCTHEIACRLLPDLPRRGVRAVAGYLGHSAGTLRRSAEHVAATAFVWRELVTLLERNEGISTWDALKAWLVKAPTRRVRSRRVWPMPRDVRLSMPDAPGVYRMLRSNGDVLYVGKAASLRHRVNSYFRKQQGVTERALEMLSQARGLSYEITLTPLEAALLEPDEIKRHRPPYNVAMAGDGRALCFAAPDLSRWSVEPSPECPLGPFPSAVTLSQFSALAQVDAGALGGERWRPDASTFDAGYASFRAVHPELSRQDLSAHERLLRLGTRLWREGRRDRDVETEEQPVGETAWTPELVQRSLEWLVLRATLARRRASWFTRLVESSVTWSEPGVPAARLLVVENGCVVTRADVDRAVVPPVPPGAVRSAAERRAAFDLASYDRLRALTTELKRLSADRVPVVVRLGAGPPLTNRRLATVLRWV